MKALILVAGRGKRLKPLTDAAPKYLTEINRKPILINDLEILQRCGIREAIIVVGHLASKVKESIGNNNFKGMRIRFVENKIYGETNNIYSVWLTRNCLDEDILLIEGGIVFEERIIRVFVR